MSSEYAIGQTGAVGAQVEEESAVVDEGPELRASVEQDVQANVDYADERRLNGRLFGQTLEAEERMAAREWEIERTHERVDREQPSDREARTRHAVAERSAERRRSFERRAASVDPWMDPDRADPREYLERAELASVNAEADRVAGELEGWTRAAVGRRLAEWLVDGRDRMTAVVGVYEELVTAPGTVVPIGELEDIDRREVSIEGTVETLWEPSSAKIQQVGLLGDETGRVKVTVWTASDQPVVREGERVRIYGAAKNWYDGRVSVAVTGWSRIEIR